MNDLPPEQEAPWQQDIRNVAKDVYETAWKVKGEKELRYIPENSHDSYLAGTKWEANTTGVPNPQGKYGAYGIDTNDIYLGTPAQWQQLREEYGWIEQEFEYRMGPSPDGFNQTISDLHSLSNGMFTIEKGDSEDYGLPPGSSGIEDSTEKARGNLSQCDGLFVTGLETYLTDLETVVKRQGMVAGTLFHAAVAARDVYARARRQLKEIGDDTVVALDVLGAGQSPSSGGGDLSVVFGVIAAAATVLAGIASIPATGGATLAPMAAATWNIVAGVSSGIALLPSGSTEEKLDLGADTVDGVLSNMQKALRKREKEFSDKEEEIAKALKHDVEIIELNSVITDTGNIDDATGEPARTPNAFLPQKPGIASATDVELTTGGIIP